MEVPKFPYNEGQRQRAVDKYKTFNKLSKESYDNITSLVAHICEVPVALITLLDYDYNTFKSHYGIEEERLPREISFCAHAINYDDDITIVTDSKKDVRFLDNPLVDDGMAIFYAGVPLVDPDGFKLGTLCVFDNKPRELNENQVEAMKTLAKQVMILFEKEYQNSILTNLQLSLQNKNDVLEKFAGVVSHDLKSPLANIISLLKIIEDENKDSFNEETQLYFNYLRSASYSLRNYIDGILSFYKSDSLLERKNELVNLDVLIDELKRMLPMDGGVSIKTNFTNNTVVLNRVALQQILLNLLSNGIRYNSKSNKILEISLNEDDAYFNFSVTDNGNGISSDNYEKIFELFQTADNQNDFDSKGSGIGLTTVKKVVESLGGKVCVTSTQGVGSVFKFSLAKTL
ncbi:MAG: GAF domain-containing sensor histidine kinase [Flavobacterium sp.]|nr:GAF domain-containing sensor histidine kinase [Flavobacterium sp.]